MPDVKSYTLIGPLLAAALFVYKWPDTARPVAMAGDDVAAPNPAIVNSANSAGITIRTLVDRYFLRITAYSVLQTKKVFSARATHPR